ncbi:hypothetical protein FA15DRAFT_710747 [Coprinopsis marcescibilis]|uniref:Alpha-type protein kinase domain-containing protein n=1 Tax=Coprinopsis marcescibilis TaxID=230819 RepID=A0A5C3KBM1_COPMA|nr:hypothetical protein FA15DRAFT_710747 [Coprinopsis marcescibilis]
MAARSSSAREFDGPKFAPNTDHRPCYDTGSDMKYGLGDLGGFGLQGFVNQHECNSICKGLGLLPLKNGAAEEDSTDKSIVKIEEQLASLSSNDSIEFLGKGTAPIEKAAKKSRGLANLTSYATDV